MRVLQQVSEELAQAAKAAQRVVVVSGAGISAESGVPTFREVQKGLWARFSAQGLATPDAFDADPATVWTWYRWRQGLIQQVEPNDGHHAVAQWQSLLKDQGGQLNVITQNVDDLHERAGAEVMAHLHGSIFEHRCVSCENPAEVTDSPYDGTELPELAEEPPFCSRCAEGRLRPSVVWFGEMLPMEAFEASAAAVRAADLVLVVGTSGIVQPAASLPLLAMERGTPLLEINPEETELSELMDFCLRGTASRLLPEILRHVSS